MGVFPKNQKTPVQICEALCGCSDIPGSPILTTMSEEISVGNVKRFGTRYGRKLKLKFGAVEREQRRRHTCPYCHALKVKRVAVGIWHCKKCDTTFTGKAYTVGKKTAGRDVQVMEIAEQETIADETIADDSNNNTQESLEPEQPQKPQEESAEVSA